MARANQKDSRFTKEHWIQKALEVLSQTGGAKIHIEKLAAKLGVTKGSFYWHFESRNDFVEQVLSYWEEKYTQVIFDHLVEQQHSTPKELVLDLTAFIFDNDLMAHEMPIRSWAVQETRVQQRVEQIDASRQKFMSEKLVELGADNASAEAFTSQFICFAHCQGFMLPPLTMEKQREHMNWLANTCL